MTSLQTVWQPILPRLCVARIQQVDELGRHSKQDGILPDIRQAALDIERDWKDLFWVQGVSAAGRVALVATIGRRLLNGKNAV